MKSNIVRVFSRTFAYWILFASIAVCAAGATTALAQSADLGVTKSVNAPTPNVGDTITFTVTLNNNGPDTATNVALSDLLPAGVIFVSASPSQGSYVSATGIWTVGTVTTSTPQTLQIQALVASPNAQTNTAAVTAADQPDPITANNSASVTVTAQHADLVIAKTVDNPTPNVGDTITYTVTVINDGPATATNVTVQDTLPAGVSLVSAAPSQGTFAAGVWTIGTVAPGTPQTLTITVTVTGANPGANTASVSHSDQFDPNPANNSDSSPVDPLQSDLIVTKTVSDSRPNVGDTITFTVGVLNEGAADAANVTVADLLPAGLTFQSATPSQGTYDSVLGVWTLGTVVSGTPQTLTIQATVVSPTQMTNTASISHADQFDPNTADNSASATVVPTSTPVRLQSFEVD